MCGRSTDIARIAPAAGKASCGGSMVRLSGMLACTVTKGAGRSDVARIRRGRRRVPALAVHALDHAEGGRLTWKPLGGQRRRSLANRNRHRTIEPRAAAPKRAPFALHDGSCECGACHPARLSWKVGSRDVHCSLRVAVDATSPERGKPRAVADKRRRPSVGLVVSSDALLALFRQGRFPYQRRGPELVAVDDA